MEIKRIETRDDLVALMNVLRIPSDWHEVDQVGVGALVNGSSFDNAGFWGAAEQDRWVQRTGTLEGVELWVTLYCDGHPVAEVNLATLFAFATGWAG
jgi:hypothetical protein